MQENDVERASARGRRGRTPADIPVRVPGRARRAGAYTGDMQALREGGAPARLAPWASPGRCAPRSTAWRIQRKVSISHLCSCLAPATVRGAARLRPPAPRPDELAAPSLTCTRGSARSTSRPRRSLVSRRRRVGRLAPRLKRGFVDPPRTPNRKRRRPLEVARRVSTDPPTRECARFASRPASALARNLDPRPARARGLGKCRRCRPGGRRQPGCTFSFGKSKNPKNPSRERRFSPIRRDQVGPGRTEQISWRMGKWSHGGRC